ncbi:MAG: UDP-N-acetylenolpyruvoylglucosamine reductase [Proteobacteria bacterium]|nr:MAG: UDP-N-acetylenolpyruvoylglucosamine reductase [Pseudomonadota bacterium]
MQIQENYSLKRLNSFGVDASTRFFTTINTTADIDALIQWRAAHPNRQCLLLGGGSNVLFRNDFDGLVVLVNLKGRTQITEDDEAYYVQAAAGENWHEFVRWTIDQGYAGLENLSLIPGTVGAAPIQNIGAYGVELADRMASLQAVDLVSGEQREFSVNDCQFAYRDSFFKSQQADRWLIRSVTFRLPKKPQWVMAYAGVEAALAGQKPTARLISDAIIALRQSKLPNPTEMGSAGSFFKNPILPREQWNALKTRFAALPGYPVADNDGLMKTSAGWLIDQCQWKAYRQGDAGVYDKHALVLVNHGSATGAELWAVAEQIQASVKDKFGIFLEAEPRVIG